MAAYLITFKSETKDPKKDASLAALRRLVQENAARRPAVEAWTFKGHKQVATGDRVFLLLQGAAGPAIIGYGSAAGPPARVDGRWQVPIEFEVIVDPTREVLATRDELRAIRGSAKAWGTRPSGVRLAPDLAEALEGLVIGRAPGPRYWWVNERRTRRQEVEEQYLWSANSTRQGSTRETNILTSMMPGNVVFSFAEGRIRAVGVVLGRAREAPRPARSGVAGAMDSGWQVPVRYMALEHTLVPKEYVSELAAVLRRKRSPLGTGGDASPEIYLAEVPARMAAKLRELLAGQMEDAVARIVSSVGAALEDDAAEEWIQQRTDIGVTEKLNLVRARRGQGLYRANLELIEQRCRVTGLLDRRHLRACHIKPWCVCDDGEKLDGFNGLLLSPHIAHLFDRGYISFSDSGDVLVAQSLNPEVPRSWGIALPRNVGPFRAEQRRYLEYHRKEVFEQKWAGGARRNELPAADPRAPVIGRV